jgi:hypothetical protein
MSDLRRGVGTYLLVALEVAEAGRSGHPAALSWQDPLRARRCCKAGSIAVLGLTAQGRGLWRGSCPLDALHWWQVRQSRTRRKRLERSLVVLDSGCMSKKTAGQARTMRLSYEVWMRNWERVVSGLGRTAA